MAGNERLELFIHVDAAKGNAEVVRFNRTLSGLEKTAVSSTRGASRGMDGLTLAMTKSVVAGQAIYDVALRAFRAMRNLTFGTLETQDAMGKTAQKLGVTIEEFSELRHIAELSGASIEQLGVVVGQLSKRMLDAAKGSREQKQAFAAIGLEFKNTDGTLRNTNAVLEDLADIFQSLPDGATKTALAMNLMGRSGKEMIPFLNQGGAAMRDARQEAHDLGRVIDEETFRAAERFNDNLTRLKGAAEGLAMRIINPLLPTLVELTDRLVTLSKTTVDTSASSNSLLSGLQAITKFALGAALAVTGFAGGLSLLAEKIQGVRLVGAELLPDFLTPDLEGLRKGLEERRQRTDAIAASVETILEMMNEVDAVFAKSPAFSGKPGLGTGADLPIVDEGMEKAAKTSQKLIDEQRFKNAELARDHLENIRDQFQTRLDYESRLYLERLKNENDIDRVAMEHAKRQITFQEQVAGNAREAALRQLELAEPQTVEQKAALEAQKAEIEIAHALRVHAIKLRLIGLETDAELTAILKTEADAETAAAVQAARENAAIRQGQIVRDEQQRTFDSLKRQGEGVFDALLDKSKSVWQAIADSFKTALLTAIKEVSTSMGARLLMQMFGGLRLPVAGGAAGGGGGLGTAGALASIAPILTGGGFGIPGIGPGGTAPTFPTGTGAATAGGLAGLKGGLLGTSALGTGLLLGGPLAALGIGRRIGGGRGGAIGGGLAAASGLAGLGLLSGLGIGAAFGPVGLAIVGGAIGIGALFGAFRKGAEEKAREKIKATYGVELKDKGLLKQIVDLAKQNFGGNLDMAIRAPQIRELIELYAMTTGQNTGSFPAQMRPLNLAMSGGNVFQVPSGGFSSTSRMLVDEYRLDRVNKQAERVLESQKMVQQLLRQTELSGIGEEGRNAKDFQFAQQQLLRKPYINGLPAAQQPAERLALTDNFPALNSLDRLSAGQTMSTRREINVPVTLEMDGQVFDERTIHVLLDNDRLISAAVVSGQKASSGRREAAALSLQQPGLLTS